MSRISGVWPVAPLLLLLAWVPSAGAEVTDFGANRCLSAKAKAVGASASARLRCHAKAAKQGVPVDAACLQKASNKLTGGELPERGAFAKLERRGGCLTEGDAAAFDAVLADFAGDASSLAGVRERSRCDAARLACAGRHAAAVMGCYARAARRQGSVAPGACLNGPAAALASCEARAEAKGDCSAELAGGEAQPLSDDRLQHWLCALDPDAGPGCSSGNPLEEFLPEGALSLAGTSTNSFNPASAPLRFVLLGARFSQDPADVAISVNDTPLDPGSLVFGPHEIRAGSVLVDGRNEISFTGVDEFGRALYLETVLWAGGARLEVTLVDEDGRPVKGRVPVHARLGDDQTVEAHATSRRGRALFENVPARMVLIQARTAANELGLIGAIGSQGSVEVVVRGFDPTSPIANNDFSLGLDGWDVGGAEFVQIVPHSEGLPDPIPPPPPQAASAKSAIAAAESAGVPRGVPGDLLLRSSGEEEQSLSRSFDTLPGTTSVRLRYRWVTSEIPCDCYGTQFNDYYSLSIRSENTGGVIADGASVNSFPLAAYDPGTGAMEWRDATLEVDPAGDTVQVDLAVSNVADGRWDSEVIVDFLEEVNDQVRPRLAWDRTRGGLRLNFEVVNGNLGQDTTIDVLFASGTGYANRVGAVLFIHVVPEGTAQGQHGPIQIAGALLTGDPAAVTHLIAAAGETHVGAVADARIAYGPNANAAVVSAGMLDVVKDALRVAGQANGIISSTARNAADQARAMFQNLVNPGTDGLLTEADLAFNINVQKNGNGTGFPGYGPSGDAVIDVFADEIGGLTPAAVVANAMQIRAAMEQEVNDQGPTNVSLHCADPAAVSVVDVVAGVFNATNGALFVGEAQGRVAGFLDERSVNGCYHLRL